MTTTTVRLSTPRETIESIPHLLGFRPSESVVMVALRGNRLLCTIRVDLDTPADEVLHAAATVTRHGATGGHLIIWTINRLADAEQAAAPIAAAWEQGGVPVLQTLITDGTHLVQPGGAVQRLDFRHTPVAAPMVTRGRAPLPSRDAYLDSLNGTPVVTVATDPATATDWLEAAARFRLDPTTFLDDASAAALLDSLDGTDILLRDRVLAALVADEDDAVPHSLVLHLERRAATRHAGIHCLLACSALLQGTPTLAHAALERVANPAHALTGLLRQVAAIGAPPEAVRAVLAQVAAEASPLAA